MHSTCHVPLGLDSAPTAGELPWTMEAVPWSTIWRLVGQLNWSASAPGVSPAFRPDGTRLAVRDTDGKECRILSAETGRLIRSFRLPGGGRDHLEPRRHDSGDRGRQQSKALPLGRHHGSPEGTLEGHAQSGLSATFHPAGTVLASNGWEGRLWLWDPVLGRPWLNVTGGSGSEFSQDGRIVIERETS